MMAVELNKTSIYIYIVFNSNGNIFVSLQMALPSSPATPDLAAGSTVPAVEPTTAGAAGIPVVKVVTAEEEGDGGITIPNEGITTHKSDAGPCDTTSRTGSRSTSWVSACDSTSRPGSCTTSWVSACDSTSRTGSRSSSGVSSISVDGLISTNFSCEHFENAFLVRGDANSERVSGVDSISDKSNLDRSFTNSLTNRRNSKGEVRTPMTISSDTSVNFNNGSLSFFRGTAYRPRNNGVCDDRVPTNNHNFSSMVTPTRFNFRNGDNQPNNIKSYSIYSSQINAPTSGEGISAVPTRRSTHQKVTRSAPLLAPPPLFSPEDEEDDHAWVDLADTSCYFECPELLESYRVLRPRLSYRSVIHSWHAGR